MEIKASIFFPKDWTPNQKLAWITARYGMFPAMSIGATDSVVWEKEGRTIIHIIYDVCAEDDLPPRMSFPERDNYVAKLNEQKSQS